MTGVKFFVYGSMSECLVHFNKISDFVSSSVPGVVQGTAFKLTVGYPVLLEEGDDIVSGQLVTLNASDLLINLLDQFHGFNQLDCAKSLYFRKTCKVELRDGTIAEDVWVYFMNPSKLPKNAAKIEGGDWKAALAAHPVLADQLTDRQKAYIQRLGAILGREIIPIDLGLYRELMKLEMIVDKGRRLALSKLGHEVFRYLN